MSKSAPGFPAKMCGAIFALAALAILQSCQHAAPPLADPSMEPAEWGPPNNGLQCRLYLDEIPFAGFRRDERRALYFQVKNVSRSQITIPVWQIADNFDAAIPRSHAVPSVQVQVVEFPDAQSIIARGYMPPLQPQVLQTGEIFTYRLADDYQIAAGRMVDGHFAPMDLPRRPLAVRAVFTGQGFFEQESDPGEPAEDPTWPPLVYAAWKGEIHSNTVYLQLAR